MRRDTYIFESIYLGTFFSNTKYAINILSFLPLLKFLYWYFVLFKTTHNAQGDTRQQITYFDCRGNYATFSED